MNYTFKNISPYLTLLAIALVSLALKLYVFNAGAPYVTIDDYTLYEAGFLVWFGEAPPQRMYFESWIAGISSILTYIGHLIVSGDVDKIGLNLVADAYRTFLETPDMFVKTYRAVMLIIDFTTAWMVFLLAQYIFTPHHYTRWLATLCAGLYLLSYSTIWCYLVARPDTVTALFAVTGLYFYYKSNFGEKHNSFYLAAISLGCATGFKLHAALFVVFIALDLIRQLGFIHAIKRFMPFGIISVFIFCVTAGSPLFDPLLYVKLRALNIKDDASPWIHWGDQIITVFRGTGWVVAPAIATAAFIAFRKKITSVEPKVISVIFMASCFLIFFLSIRQLRAYWMLPALPLFYIVSVHALSTIKSKIAISIVLLVTTSIFIMQSINQSKEFDNAQYGELKLWVKNNVKTEDVIYIIGYDTLFLPCNTTCLANRKISIERMLTQAIKDNENYTFRHIRQWEERARLQFIDMLNARSENGFNYYSLNGFPLATLEGLVSFKDIKYAIVLPGYNTPEANELLTKVKQEFTKVVTVNAPGGKAGTGGLPYDIYVRNK